MLDTVIGLQAGNYPVTNSLASKTKVKYEESFRGVVYRDCLDGRLFRDPLFHLNLKQGICSLFFYAVQIFNVTQRYYPSFGVLKWWCLGAKKVFNCFCHTGL